MDTINPWLDPSEVRQLAEKLIRPVEQTPVVSKNPGFDTSFVGFTDSDEPVEETAAAPQAPAPAQAPVKPQTPAATLPPAATIPAPSVPAAPSIPVIPPTPQPAEKTAPAAKVTTLSNKRFLHFRNTLAQHYGAKEIFILDHTGTVIFDESHHGRLHFIARDLILQAGQPNNVRVKFGPAANLELIPCENPQGLVILGALFPQSLPTEQITNIREALSQSLSA